MLRKRTTCRGSGTVSAREEGSRQFLEASVTARYVVTPSNASPVATVVVPTVTVTAPLCRWVNTRTLAFPLLPPAPLLQLASASTTMPGSAIRAHIPKVAHGPKAGERCSSLSWKSVSWKTPAALIVAREDRRILSGGPDGVDRVRVPRREARPARSESRSLSPRHRK
jgi:hypothetical protein